MTVLADTSAWIEFLRGTGSRANVAVREALRCGSVMTSDPIVMELLAGARDDREEARLAALLGVAEHLPCTRDDFIEAARIHRTCRAAGDTVRSMVDCMVAAVAIRHDVSVTCRDRDFASIARHVPLRLAHDLE